MEAKTTLARRQDAVQGDFMRKMLTNAGCLLCGILVSRGAVLGSLAPFGASFAAAVPRKYLLSSLLGTAFGYVLLKPSDSFRYLAVVAAIGGGCSGILTRLQKARFLLRLWHLFRFLQRVFRCFS